MKPKFKNIFSCESKKVKIHPRLEVPEEMDCSGGRRGGGESERRGWRELVRIFYYKHYEAWPALIISLLLGETLLRLHP